MGPAPNLPYWKESNGTVLTQTHAILHHLGDQHGLAGSTSAERTRVIMAAEVIEDWSRAFKAVTYCDAPGADAAEVGAHCVGAAQCMPSPRFESLKHRYLRDALPRHLGIVAAMLSMSSGGWIAATGQPSYADFVLYECLDQHEVFASDAMATQPNIDVVRAFVERFTALAGVSAYRQGPTFQAEPLHNVYSHFHRGWVGAKLQTPVPVAMPEKHVQPRTWRSTCRDVVVMGVLLLVMMALCLLAKHAIQFNELEADIEQVGEEIVMDFVDSSIPCADDPESVSFCNACCCGEGSGPT